MTNSIPDRQDGQSERDPLTDLGALGRVIREMRARLKPGGPEVDEAALYAYLAGALPDHQQKIVAQRIETWQQWYEAYWKLCTDVDTGETALEDRKRVDDESD